MKRLLSLVSLIYDKGNTFITQQLKTYGVEGLVPSHGDILVKLYTNGKMPMKDIAREIHRTKPTVTILVNKLEKLGYIKREHSGKDNRYTYITLTPKGEEFRPVFEKISRDLNNMLYRNLSEQEAETLDKLLDKCK